MVAEGLHHAGLFLGDHLIPPAPSNPRGHFEDSAVVRLHDRILSRHGTSWLFHGEVALDADASDHESIREFVSSRDSKHSVWGLKDPRICLFLDSWLANASKSHLLVVYRHWTDCASSLLSRHAWELAINHPKLPSQHFELFRRPDLGARAWLAYNRRLVAACHTHAARTLVVSHAALLEGYPLFEELSNRFALPLDSGLGLPIDNQLVHHALSATLPGISEALRQELDETWDALQRLSQAPATEAARRPARTLGPLSMQKARAMLGIPDRSQASTADAQGTPSATPSAPSAEELAQATLTECGERARACLKQKRPGDALMWFNEAIGRKPQIAWVHAQKAHALFALEELDAAAMESQQAVELRPDHAPWLLQLARFRDAQAREAEALALCDRALALEPQSYPALMLHARLIAKRGDPEGAAADYQSAIQLEPMLPQALTALAALYFSQGYYTQASLVADQLLSKHPTLVPARRMAASYASWANASPQSLRHQLKVLGETFDPELCYSGLQRYVEALSSDGAQALLFDCFLAQLERFRSQVRRLKTSPIGAAPETGSTVNDSRL